MSKRKYRAIKKKQRVSLLVTWSKMFTERWTQRMSDSEKILFTEQLASMLKAGLPMIEALGAFIDEKRNSGSSKMIGVISEKIRTGVALSDALGEYPHVFSEVYMAVVKSGEGSGTLAESLEYLAKQMKRETDLKGKVRGALIYPTVVLVSMIAVMTFISISVVPKIVEFARSSGQELPVYTRVIVSVTDGIAENWVLVLLGIGSSVVGVSMALKSERGKKWSSKVVLKIPAVGKLVARYNQARFARLLGGFYQHGVSVTGSFDILARSLSNVMYKEASFRMKKRLEAGQSLADSLEAEEELFPSIVSRLVRGAEKTGELGPTLDRLSVFYEEQLEVALKNVTVLIEPLLVIILGLGVLAIAMAVVVPIYNVSSGLT